MRKARSILMPSFAPPGTRFPRVGLLTPGSEAAWDNQFAWRIEYIATYRCGMALRRTYRYRVFLAEDRDSAINELAKLAAGSGAGAVEIVHIQAPPDADMVAFLRRYNDRTKKGLRES